MDLIALTPAFVVAVVLISASPGPAMALIVRRSAVHGWQAAVPTVLGVELGLYIWALSRRGRVRRLVAVSRVGVPGAQGGRRRGARCWHGRAGVAAARGVATDPVADGAGVRSGRGRSRAFAEGVVVQLANPKVGDLHDRLLSAVRARPNRPLFATTALLALLQVMIETVVLRRPGVRRRSRRRDLPQLTRSAPDRRRTGHGPGRPRGAGRAELSLTWVDKVTPAGLARRVRRLLRFAS